MNIKSLSLNELITLQKKVNSEIVRRKDVNRRLAKKEVRAVAKKYGLLVSDLDLENKMRPLIKDLKKNRNKSKVF